MGQMKHEYPSMQNALRFEARLRNVASTPISKCTVGCAMRKF
jgi:hypothetical protein